MSSCVKCGNLNKPGTKFCKFCGEKVAAALVTDALSCVTCAAPLLREAKFCKTCGTAVAGAATPITAATAPLAPIDPIALVAPAVAVEPPAPADFAVAAPTVGQPIAAEPLTPAESPAYVEPLALRDVPAPIESAAPTQSREPESPAVADQVAATLDIAADGSAPLQYRAPSPAPKIIAALCAVAVIAGGGLYAYERSAPLAPAAGSAPASVASQAPAAASEPAAPAPETAPVAASAPVKPATPDPLASESLPAKPVAQAPSETRAHATELARTTATPAPTSAPASARQAQAITQPVSDLNEAMARKVSMLLYKANGYLENKQYDKAIATAENALELDPRSSAAHTMINNAKSKQLEALRSGSTLE